MKIFANQALHGYENGHQLLKASCRLDIDDRKKMDGLSDLNGITDEDQYVDYYTGYPIANGAKYVIAKTWYAYEKKRPGCAWTHSLIFNIGDFEKLTDLNKLFDAFRRPDESSKWSYMEPITFEIGEEKKSLDIERHRLEYLIYTVFASSDPKFVVVDKESFVNELFQVLNIMPNQILKTFTFSTMSYSCRRYGNEPFQYQMISERNSYLFHGRYKHISICEDIDKIKRYPYWVECYADVILSDLLADLNNFILQYSEYAWSLNYYNCFVRLFFALMNDKMTLGKYLDAIEQVIADLKEELWQKSVDLILDENFLDHYFKGREYEILEMLDMGKFILSAGRRKKMEDQIIRNSPEKLYPILKKYIVGDIKKHEKQEIENIIIKLKPEDLKTVSKMDENICVVLVRINSRLLLSKEIWKQPKDFQRALIYSCDRQISDEILKNLVELILYHGTQNISMDLYTAFGENIIKIFYHVMNQGIDLDDNKLFDWANVLMKDQKLLINKIKIIPKKGQRKRLFLKLDFDSKDLLEEIDGKIWEDIYIDIFKTEANKAAREQLAVEFFKIIFNSKNVFSEEFVHDVVGEVYTQLEKNELPFDYWMQIEYLLPEVEVQYSWDKCLRVRNALEQRGVSMEQIFITNLTIKKVRYLRDISIPLSKEKAKHLILTGKNGSGKTSLTEALAEYLNKIVVGERENAFRNCQQQLDIKLNHRMECIPGLAEQTYFILAYYAADRIFKAEQPKHDEKVQLKEYYELTEFLRNEFVKYLLDLKMTEAFSRDEGVFV